MPEGNLENSQNGNCNGNGNKSRFQRFLGDMFNQSGGVYVGMATILTFVCLVCDSYWDSWKTPEWWTTAPLGVYCVILITFAGSKILNYLTDSKYNSPAGTPPK